MRIYLIGYIAADKNKWGQKIANKLNLDFVDTRKIMEQKSNLSFKELLQHKELFIKLEQETLSEIIKLENTVIATSELLPCRANNMEILNKTGITFYLKAGLGCIMMKIVKKLNTIPLLTGIEHNFIPDFIKMELTNRKPFYTQAQISYLERHLDVNILIDLLNSKIKTHI